jgi:hypothetical protein
VAATLNEVGVHYLTVDLTDMQGGDATEISMSVPAGPSQSRSVQVQSFSGDQGLTAAEFVFAFSADSASSPELIIEQSAGTARDYDWSDTVVS